MARLLSVFNFILFGGLLIFIFSSGTNGTKGPDSGQGLKKTINSIVNHLPQKIKSVNIAANSYSFAGQEIPIENFDVKERLDRELTVNSYYHSNTLLSIKRANRFFPIIEKILEEENVPQDFKYLAVAESSLENVRSPAGAKGYWQFMTATAKQYGLEVNKTVDERYHIEKSTRAACKLIKDYEQKFGSWILAAAAYNMGINALSKEMARQKADSYYDLNLGSETSRYVFRIIALKYILTDPASYGFEIEDNSVYKTLDDYKIVNIDQTIPNIGEFAEKHNTTYRMIKVYNPWLISSSLPVVNKKYEIKIPE